MVMMQYGARCPTEEEMQSKGCLEADSAVFRGASLIGLLDLNVMLLSYCLDNWSGVPPASHDLWLSRALIIARAWNLLETEPDFAAYSPGGSPGVHGMLSIPEVVRYMDDVSVVLLRPVVDPV